MRLETPQWYECSGIWPDIERGVAAALSHGGIVYTPEDILHALLSRHMKLWIARENGKIMGFCIAQIEVFLRARICAVIVIAGKCAKQWLHLCSAVEEWGRGMGAQFMQGVGRHGWKKVAAPQGYEAVAVIYRKKL